MPTTITAPSDWPISIENVKAHLRQSSTWEDAYIQDRIKSAVVWAENYTGQYFAKREVKEYFKCLCDENTLSEQIVSGTVKLYYMLDGTYVEMSEEVYEVDTLEIPAKIYLREGQQWPTADAVRYPYRAEYPVGSDTILPDVEQAILLKIGFLFENREDVRVSEAKNPAIRSAQVLLEHHRIWTT